MEEQGKFKRLAQTITFLRLMLICGLGPSTETRAPKLLFTIRVKLFMLGKVRKKQQKRQLTNFRALLFLFLTLSFRYSDLDHYLGLTSNDFIAGDGSERYIDRVWLKHPHKNFK